MTALVQFHKVDTTARITTSTSAEEETNYTVSWSDLTTAGFANGDAVAIIVKVRFRNSSGNNYTSCEVSVGSSFAGASILTNTLSDREGASTTRNSPYLALGTDTLATNDNIYFRKWVNTGTGRYDDFDIWVIKTADLGANYQVATSNPSGNAPTSDTDGASLSLAAGNWWCFAMSQWLDDSTTADARMWIDVGGTDVAEVRYEGEDTANTMNLGTEAFVALGSTTTVKIQYASDTTNTHDCEWTALHALNLDAFADSWGHFDNSTTSPAATATWYEYEGNNAFTLSATGDVMALGFFTNYSTNAGGSAINRVTLDGSAWPDANWCDTAGLDNGTTAATVTRQPNFTVGYGNKTAGTYDFAFEYNEDASTGVTTDVIDERSAAIFSMELASGGGTTTEDIATASFTITPASVGSLYHHKTQIASAAFAITAAVVGSLHTYTDAIASATFAITPAAIGSLNHHRSQIASASYVITAASVGSLYHQRDQVSSATFSITPSTVGSLVDRKTQIAAASYVITAASIGEIYNHRDQIVSTTFSFTPSDIGSAKSYVSQIGATSYAIVSGDIGDLYNRRDKITSATFSITTSDVGSTKSFVSSIAQTSFTLTAANIGELYNRSDQVVSASFSITPGSVASSKLASSPSVNTMNYPVHARRRNRR